ncbi:MAG: methyltransferase domain-containing protein [Balneolaceae bacterium]|nr:methyltransferase domain-containing protein [Balneolaceae bacterium]
MSEQDRAQTATPGRGFGASAETYHRTADVQKEVAERLIASLQPWRDIVPPGPVVELGCGTGFVTESLLEMYPGRELWVTDRAPEMVDFCRERFGEREGLRYEAMGAEEYERGPEEVALTVSGFSAQWFRDPPFTLGRWLERTRSGGLLLASFPGHESFPEWREQCRELGLPFTGNVLPDTEEMVIKLTNGPAQVDYYEDTVTRNYDSSADFFRHLKAIGADRQLEGRRLTPREMRMLIRNWDRSAGDRITVSYHVVFIAVKRD